MTVGTSVVRNSSAPRCPPVSPALDASLQLLDLDHDATLSDAKKARRELALIWHPDRFPESEALRARAEEKLKRINEAYARVTDYLRVAAPREALNTSPEPAAPEGARKTVTLAGVPVEANVLQRSLGLEVGGNRFAEILTAGTTVPCAAAKTFTNAQGFPERAHDPPPARGPRRAGLRRDPAGRGHLRRPPTGAPRLPPHAGRLRHR